MIGAAKLPGHLNLMSSQSNKRDSVINAHVQAVVTMLPGHNHAPRMPQLQPTAPYMEVRAQVGLL